MSKITPSLQAHQWAQLQEPKDGFDQDKIVFNSIDFEHYERPEILKNRWPVVYVLKIGQGYLDPKIPELSKDFESHLKPSFYLHRQTDGTVLNEVPIPADTNGARWFRYVRYRDSYFGYLWQPDPKRIGLNTKLAGEDWLRLACLKGYWFDAKNGRVEEVCLPSGPWAENFRVRVFPVKNGYVIIKKNVNKLDEAYYAVNHTGYRRLLRGEFSNISVSPDGTKIAFGHAWSTPSLPYPSETHGYATIKMIDLANFDTSRFKPYLR